jgi:hypothetical protein
MSGNYRETRADARHYKSNITCLVLTSKPHGWIQEYVNYYVSKHVMSTINYTTATRAIRNTGRRLANDAVN